jgi:hypothetical protein
MSEAIRFAIEKRQKLKEELVLQQEDFLINTVSKSHVTDYRNYATKLLQSIEIISH